MKEIHAGLAGWTSRGQNPSHTCAACEEHGERCSEDLQGPGAAKDGMQILLAAGGNVFMISAGDRLSLPQSIRAVRRCSCLRAGVTADAICGDIKIFNPLLEIIIRGVIVKVEIKRAQ